jgi:hypothetical protein
MVGGGYHSLDSGALLIPAGNQGSPSRTADSAVGMEIGKPNSFFCQPIEIGGADGPAAVATTISVSHVVGEDKNDIWTLHGNLPIFVSRVGDVLQ